MRAITSPSTSRSRSPRGGTLISGQAAVTLLSLRLVIRTRPSRTSTRTRTPSHLTSCSHCAPVGTRSVLVASIGRTRAVWHSAARVAAPVEGRRLSAGTAIVGHASDLEGCRLLRPGQRPGQAVCRHREPRRLVPAGARQGRRADQVPARLLPRRRGGGLRRHRQGLRDRGRRDGHPHRRRHGRAAVDVVAGDLGREVRAARADRPAALREVLLPRARGRRRQAVRAAAPGAARRRPDGGRDGRAAPAHHHRRAAGRRTT